MGNDFLGSDGSRDPDAKRIAKFEGRLDLVDMQYGFSMNIPEFSKVIEYAKECLKEIRPGKTNTILQLKCPVVKKNASGETISLALGGNCPDEKCWSICTVRCADQLFGGKDNLQKFFIFNLRVECRIDEKTGRCAVCSPREAQALGTVYEILCQYAFEIGAKMNYISMAGTSSGIESTLGNWYLKNKCHPDGTPYFVNYMPNGYHLSLLSYYCDKFRTIEEQVRSSGLCLIVLCSMYLISSATVLSLYLFSLQARKITDMVKNISDALGDPALFTNALANQYLPFVVNWDTMSKAERVEMESFWRTLQGRTNLGNYTYLFKIGIFADEYAELRAIWSKQGGECCYELGHGIYDEDHPMLKAAGCTNWGQWCLLEGKGIFDPDHPKLKALGVTNFGEWCVLMAKGIFDPDHPKLKAAGCNNFGEWCVLMAKGIFDPDHPKLKAAGCNNFGEYIVLKKRGLYNPANAQVVLDGQIKGGNTLRDQKIGLIGAKIDHWRSRIDELREYTIQNKHSFVPKGHSLYVYVTCIRVYYRKTIKDRNAVTDEDIRHIIKGDAKLKAHADMDYFCFVPPHPSSKGSCGCRHCTRKHFR